MVGSAAKLTVSLAYVFHSSVLTVHFVYLGAIHLFQVRPMSSVIDPSMYIPNHSVEGMTCEELLRMSAIIDSLSSNIVPAERAMPAFGQPGSLGSVV